MAATKVWFLRDGVHVQGPMSSAELKQIAKTGRITAETEVAQSENGPWRPARQVKGLELKQVTTEQSEEPDDEPEMPFSFAPRPIASEPETSPEVIFDTAPTPAATPEPPPMPPMKPRMSSPFRRKDEQYPEYRALRAYGSLFRVLGVVAAILAVLVLVLGILGAVFSRDDRLAATANAAQTLILFSGFALTAFMLFVPADVIFAYVDLVKDARRQRIATERSNALLAELLTAQAAMLEGK